MPASLLNNFELLQLLRSRSITGAEALYDQYAPILGLAIFRIVGQKELTHIILEKTICKIWDTVVLYNEQETSLLNWMLNTAKTLAKEAIALPVAAITT
ncbi:hypothetical protein BDD43_3933 [Mucilaginibacter gracilis]|uniref:Sigma-70-like protein n=1 Tax=Mucilaginibacter gracilis TaxID=423350 RepID=A0A495J6S7_9SPHI|nr:hypothetical protein [Mucilaginibacter gracilis]RKR83719.1 hypothetical protein BDD43_3933 [Mucilaginibacter gracilis]